MSKHIGQSVALLGGLLLLACCVESSRAEMSQSELAQIHGGATKFCVIALNPDPNGLNCYDCSPANEKCDSSGVDKTWQTIPGMDPANVMVFDPYNCGGMTRTFAAANCANENTPFPPALCTRQHDDVTSNGGAPGVTCP